LLAFDIFTRQIFELVKKNTRKCSAEFICRNKRKEKGSYGSSDLLAAEDIFLEPKIKRKGKLLKTHSGSIVKFRGRDLVKKQGTRGGDLVKKQGIRGGDLVKKKGIRGRDLVKKQGMRGVRTSLKNQEPALNRGLTGERPTSDLAPS